MSYTFCSARIIADTFNVIRGHRLTTFEVKCPLFVYNELRAMPGFVVSRPAPETLEQMAHQVRNHPVTPAFWQIEAPNEDAVDLWRTTAQDASETVLALHEEQDENDDDSMQLLAPFRQVQVVVSSTEYNTFFHEWTDPSNAGLEMQALAWEMAHAYFARDLEGGVRPGYWHLPYIDREVDTRAAMTYLGLQVVDGALQAQVDEKAVLPGFPEGFVPDNLSAAERLILEVLIATSVVRCAQASDAWVIDATQMALFNETLLYRGLDLLGHVAQATTKKDYVQGPFQGWNTLSGLILPALPSFDYEAKKV